MALLFIIDQDILDGYPHLQTLGNFPDTQVAPYPIAFLRCNQQYLDGYPSFGKNFPNTQISPYPSSMMFTDQQYLDGYPSFGKSHESFGAFKNTQSLISVQIPQSVKEIGDFSFTGTSLLNVTISRDCKYNEDTSFPEDCNISFY